MFRLRIGVICAFPLLALPTGCSGAGADAPPPPAAEASRRELAPPPRELIYLEVTPAAAAELKAHVADLKLDRWWLRYTLQPGGCQGFQSKLDLDPVPPTGEDFAFVADGIPCVVLKRQRDLVQGTQIDFGEKDGKKGFIVTAPHASTRTREAVGKWIMDEFRKRNPDLPPAESKTTGE